MSETAGESSSPPVEATPQCETCCALYQRFLKNPVYLAVSDLLHWKDVVETGIVFVILNLFFYLITYGEYTILGLFAYLHVTLLSVAAAYVGVYKLKARFRGETFVNPLVERFKDRSFHLNSPDWQETIDLVVDTINLASDHAKRALFVENLLHTVKWIVGFYIFGIFARCFSGVTLLYLVTLVAFVWPRLYTEKQVEIDRGFNLAKEKAAFYYGEALKKVPPEIKKKLE